MIYVIKRDGSKVPYTRDRIIKAINGANKESTKQIPEQNVEKIVNSIELKIQAKNEISVEDIQDLVENFLMEYGYFEVAKKYITYRYKHMIRRENKRNLMETYKDIFFTPASDMDDKRENANINTNSPMGIMLKLGTEGAKQFLSNILPEEFEKAHAEGWLHQHDRDFSLITWNCCQIDLLKVFHGGFSTGHGHLREPNSIRSYAALACIVVQANQNDFFGGQSINCWDTAMAEGIRKTFKNAIIEQIALSFVYTWDIKDYDEIVELGLKFVDEFNIRYLGEEETLKGILDLEYKIAKNLKNKLGGYYVFDEDEVPEILDRANRKTVEETHQAMEAAIHNFCSLHSRAGSQTPFSSINFGMDTTPEGRLAIKETLNAINSGLGNHETAIFPISIFVIKDGINYKEGDPNYDLFKYACKVSAKRLYPNFLSQDATFNMQYYVPGNYNTYAASMG
jgi:ribonucleoside-triphosphate reductase